MPTTTNDLVPEFRVRLSIPNRYTTCTISSSDRNNLQQDVTVLLVQATGKEPKFVPDQSRGIVQVYHDSFMQGQEPLATINEILESEHMSVRWNTEQRKAVLKAA